MPRVSEFFAPDGTVRPHQELLRDFFRTHTDKQHESLRHAVQSRVREQEVSYNVFGAPDYSHRPWRLDEVPHVLPGDEFDGLARGLSRRGLLLDACLQDIYGPQRLLRERVIPPDVVLGNPHFFRPLHGLLPLGPTRLVLFASDVVKTSDGTYLVHSDRTAAPTGSGYALENRLVMGQILSEPFRKYRTRKINRFFDVMRQALRELSPANSGVPRIVLLTPGVEDESSFEHAYLARYQGYELVEGRDLTVRGEEVFLKTLEGLKKVDVILRRVADDWCDPLELREDSLLGVSGLVGAARAQTVGIANALGSGLIESPVFRAYLPAMSQALFGEPLALDSIPTRHMGDSVQREEVLDTFGEWLFRPAFADRRGEPRVAGALEPAEQVKLRAAVLAEPYAFVAEKWPVASIVPVSSRLENEGALSLRLFCCRVGAEYFVMPGGLGRVDDTPDGMFLAPRESTSKDVWVVGDVHSEVPSPPRMPDEQLTIRRGGVGLPSRLFDDIYWLSRYAERCYGTARLVRTGLEPMTSEDRDLPPELMDALVRTLISMKILTPSSAGAPQFERALLAAIYDKDRENSIRFSLARMHDLTTRARSRLSRDAWRVLRRLTGLFDKVGDQEMTVDQAVDQLDELLLSLSAFHGIISSNMVRGHAWIFLELGRRIEHSVFVLTLLDQLFQKPGSRILMETLLTICDSLLTYRARYLSALQAAPAVDLVLTDDSNPQSVLFQLRRLLECVRALPREERFPLSRAEQRLIVLQARLETADVYRACRDRASDLRDLAEEGINLLWQVSDDLTQTYFTHASRHHAMAPAHRVDQGGGERVKYTVLHRTTYEYESPVLHGRHVIRQRPRPLPFQTVASSVLRVDPRPVWSRQAADYFGNLVDYIEVIEPHDRLEVDTVSVVSVGRRPVDEGLPLFRQSWEAARDRIAQDSQLFDAREMCLDSPLVKRQEALSAFAKDAFEPGRGLLDAVIDFNKQIFEDFTYDPHVTDVATPIDVVLKERRGVCQDFAHVAVGALRSLGLAARYVSGYLETMPPPGKPRLVGADASHAWASVLVPDYGWVSFDPTNGVLPGERHVVAAWGRDFSDVSPLRGVVLGGGRHTLAVGVDVAPEKPVQAAPLPALARGWEST